MEEDQDRKKPSHIAFHVRESEKDKSYFNRVGAAFEHQDQGGFTISLDSMPLDGRIVLRTPRERLDDLQQGSSRTKDRRRDKDRDR